MNLNSQQKKQILATPIIYVPVKARYFLWSIFAKPSKALGGNIRVLYYEDFIPMIALYLPLKLYTDCKSGRGYFAHELGHVIMYYNSSIAQRERDKKHVVYREPQMVDTEEQAWQLAEIILGEKIGEIKEFALYGYRKAIGQKWWE